MNRILGSSLKLTVLLLILSSTVATARVFDFKNESIAPYFRGTGGFTSIGNEAIVNAKGSGVSLSDDEAMFNYSGEFGVLFHLHEMFSFRLAVEAIKGQDLSEIKGSNAGGAELYTVESDTFIFNPNVAIEIIHSQSNALRFFSYLGLGRGSLTLENDYRFTAAGTSAFSIDPYIEKSESSALSYFGGVGLEALLVDTTTIQLDVGYRHLKFTQLKHKGNITTLQGSFSKGDVVENDGGSGRQLDFSGLYMGLSFRFYIEII